jgi:hypothetical protein
LIREDTRASWLRRIGAVLGWLLVSLGLSGMVVKAVILVTVSAVGHPVPALVIALAWTTSPFLALLGWTLQWRVRKFSTSWFLLVVVAWAAFNLFAMHMVISSGAHRSVTGELFYWLPDTLIVIAAAVFALMRIGERTEVRLLLVIGLLLLVASSEYLEFQRAGYADADFRAPDADPIPLVLRPGLFWIAWGMARAAGFVFVSAAAFLWSRDVSVSAATNRKTNVWLPIAAWSLGVVALCAWIAHVALVLSYGDMNRAYALAVAIIQLSWLGAIVLAAAMPAQTIVRSLCLVGAALFFATETPLATVYVWSVLPIAWEPIRHLLSLVALTSFVAAPCARLIGAQRAEPTAASHGEVLADTVP